DESAKDLEKFHQGLIEQMLPLGALEEQLVERIAICAWRLRRVYRIEARLFAAGDGFVLRQDSLLQLSRHETTIERSYHRPLHDLERFQARRKGETVMAPVALDISVGG